MTLEERVEKLERDRILLFDALEAAARSALSNNMVKVMLQSETRKGIEAWLAQREAERANAKKQATV